MSRYPERVAEPGKVDDLYSIMRTTRAVRSYQHRDVPDDVLYRVFEHARFAPSGGNRQGWRVVVVRSAAIRRALRDLYQEPWRAYVAKHYGAASALPVGGRRRLAEAEEYAERLHEIPVHLAFWIDLDTIEATDGDRGHVSVVAGGSIFPLIQNVQLACRYEGLGSRITTLLSRRQDEVRSILRVPNGYALACVMMVGYPVDPPRHGLSRRPVHEFVRTESFDGSPLVLSVPLTVT